MSRNHKDDSSAGRPRRSDEHSSRPRLRRNSHDEVQRVVEDIRKMPDDKFRDILDDADFLEGLSVVDTWDRNEEIDDDDDNREHKDRDGRRGNSRDRNRRPPGNRDRDRERDRLRREERRRDDARRDPSKSNQDIERDKIRAKRVTDSKNLADREKALKTILDSDTVVPPGTEADVIENERQLDRDRTRRSRERRRSLDRHRLSPPIRRRSHDRIRLSPHRLRSPLISPERRRSAERRKFSWERRQSLERRERRGSVDRHRRRIEERDLRLFPRRSRSRERQRSRSIERIRRWSRSPIGRRGGSRHRTLSKSPDRRRKRSPFINEISRQFRDDIIPPESMNQGFLPPPMRGMPPPQQSAPPQMMNQSLHQMPMTPQHYLPHPETIQHSLPPSGPPNVYVPYDVPAGPPVNFEPLSMSTMTQSEYSSGPVLYNQSNPLPMHQPEFPSVHMRSPQPVPAPTVDQSIMFSPSCRPPMQSSRSPAPERIQPDVGRRMFSDREPYNGTSSRRERMKTPEPPVISQSKPFEKTSLSSLLEASVSSKDSGHPVLYPGFKPEILRTCELALRDLPDEDPRLKIKGRFFFDPSKEEPQDDAAQCLSNSILLQKNKNKILWEKIKEKPVEDHRSNVETHQKYCQTDNSVDTKTTQTLIETADFNVQCCPGELQPPREEKRTIMDRLDGNSRDPFDFGSKRSQVMDLRHSLNSQKRSMRGMSPDPPNRHDSRSSLERLSHTDHDSRDFHRLPPIRRNDNFPMHRGSNRRSFSPEDFSPDYHHDLDEDYHENRRERSHERSPIPRDDNNVDDDDVIITHDDSFSRESNWRGRGKSFGSFNSHKSRSMRGKFSGSRPFRGGRGSFRGGN